MFRGRRKRVQEFEFEVRGTKWAKIEASPMTEIVPERKWWRFWRRAA